MTVSSLDLLINSEHNMLNKMQDMNTQAAFVVRTASIQPTEFSPPVSRQSPVSFSEAMTKVLDVVNEHQSMASQKITAVELGQSDDLVGAMIASQKASLSFNGLMQVRNKVVAAVEDIMKMPV